jgi:hypothetical protein
VICRFGGFYSAAVQESKSEESKYKTEIGHGNHGTGLVVERASPCSLAGNIETHCMEHWRTGE